MAKFDIKTSRWIELFGNETYPEGHLIYISIPNVGNKWSVVVLINPAGDKEIHLKDHGKTKLVAYPARTTADMLMLPNDEKRRYYDKLPNYVKEELNTVSGLAMHHLFGLPFMPTA